MKPVLIVFVILVVAAQFVPVKRTNPAVTAEVTSDVEAREVLKRACYDCHSNQTVWPWYSYVAPVSWLVTRDVNHARSHVNFSLWNQYKPDKQKHIAEEVVDEVRRGDMPLWYYRPLHPHAKLEQEDIDALQRWASSLSEENPTTTPEADSEESGHTHEL